MIRSLETRSGFIVHMTSLVQIIDLIAFDDGFHHGVVQASNGARHATLRAGRR
jgi:hypothetical protein